MSYELIAKNARKKVLEMIYKAQTSHIGSNFSVIDILTVLFENIDSQKDEVILSAGWKAAAWYYFLWKKRIITEEELNSFCQEGSKFIGLVEPMSRWGLRCAGGSMGMGFPFAAGLALAKKLKNEDGTVYVIMSDGELQCGTTWETSQIAAHHQLKNLIVIVDFNELQAMGKTQGILGVPEVSGQREDAARREMHKWLLFGWKSGHYDGHNYEQMKEMLFPGIDITSHDALSPQPKIIIARTIKGKGISFMENNNLYHYKAPSEQEYRLALKEIEESSNGRTNDFESLNGSSSLSSSV